MSKNNTENEDGTSNEEVKIKKKISLGRIIPKKIKVPSPTNEFEEKIDKVLDSVAQLLTPFKEIMLKVVPKSKPVIKSLDKLALFIAAIVRIVVRKLPSILSFLRGKYFKLLAVLLIFLFLFGAIFSRFINSPSYIRALEHSIYTSTGYRAEIGGKIKVSFLPKISVALNNVTFYSDTNSNNNAEFKISKFNTDSLYINFKWLKLFFGQLEVNDVEIIGANVDVQVSSSSTQSTLDYEKIIDSVESAIKTKVITSSNHDDNQPSSGVKALEETTEPETSKGIYDKSSDEQDQTDLYDVPSEETTLLSVSDTYDLDSQVKYSDYLLINEQLSYVEAPQQLEPRGIFTVILYQIIDSIEIQLKDINNLNIRMGSINIMHGNDRLIVIDSINATVQSQLWGSLSSEGNFRFEGNNLSYDTVMKYGESKLDFDFNLYLPSSSNAIFISGYKDIKSGQYFGEINSKEAIFTFIDSFITDIDSVSVQKGVFQANFLLTPSSLLINNMNMVVNGNVYGGSFLWEFNNGGNVKLDITAKIPDITQYVTDINKVLQQEATAKGSTFLSLVAKVVDWKNSKINYFKANNFMVNFKVDNTKLNAINVKSLSLGFMINNANKLYVYDFNLDTPGAVISTVGRVDIDSKMAIMSAKSTGNIRHASKVLGFKDKATDFLSLIAKDNSYNFSTKINLENNKIIFADIFGNLGSREIKNSYIIVTERVNNMEVAIRTKLKSADFQEISDIYNNQLSSVSYENVNDADLFGISENLDFTLELEIDQLSIKGLQFKDAVSEIALYKNGFNVSKFTANGESGGSIVAAFSADTKVSPVIAGHLNIEGLVIKFEEAKTLFFGNYNVIGNVVLNGKLKFNGDNFKDPISKLDGEVTFIKQERLKLNRFANIDGGELYMTLSEKTVKGKHTVFVNDAYGKAVIKNNIIELYPIALLYIHDEKEYRGVAQVLVDVKKHTMKGNGDADLSDDITNKLVFKVDGDIVSPVVDREFFKTGKSAKRAKIKKKKDFMSLNDDAYKVLNNLNDKKSKKSFNKMYSLNKSSKKQDKIEKQLYDDNLSQTEESYNKIRLPENSNIPSVKKP